MFYVIYKTTNLVNGKFYIGKHKTKNLDDGYMGSGKLLRYAMKKYGTENFHREILHECYSEKHMNTLEKILVVSDTEINYNLCPGGHGGFGYINSSRAWDTKKHNDAATKNSIKATEKLQYLARNDDEWKKRHSAKIKQVHPSLKDSYVGPFKGKSHTSDSKKKMSKSKNKGQLNSQFGTMWITNGKENKKIKKEVDIIPDGWYKGRYMNP